MAAQEREAARRLELLPFCPGGCQGASQGAGQRAGKRNSPTACKTVPPPNADAVVRRSFLNQSRSPDRRTGVGVSMICRIEEIVNLPGSRS